MQWLALSTVLWIALGVVGLRWLRRRRKKNSLCHRCRYDLLDICDRPERPYAQECDLFQELEDEDDGYCE